MSENKGMIDHNPLADIEDEDSDTGLGLAGTTGAPSVEAQQAAAPEPEPEPEPEPLASMADGVLDLESSLTIAEVSDWHGRLLTIFDSGAAITLKGGELDQIDGSGLQLLAALMKEAAEQQVEINWESASDNLRQAAADIGLAGTLRLD